MPGPDSPWGSSLVRAVKDGLVAEDAVDDRCAGCSGSPAAWARWNRVGRVDRAGSRRRRPATPGRCCARRQCRFGPAAQQRRPAGRPRRAVQRRGRRRARRGPARPGRRQRAGSSAPTWSPRWRASEPGCGAGPGSYTSPARRRGPRPLPRHRPVRRPALGRPGVLLRVLDAAGRELRSEHRLSGRQLEPDLPPGRPHGGDRRRAAAPAGGRVDVRRPGLRTHDHPPSATTSSWTGSSR